MSEQTWTIDLIAHALPHPLTRQKFLSEINLAPVEQLPEVVARWVRLVERLDASRPALERVLQFAQTHHGELPHQYADDGRTDEWLAQWGASLGRGSTDAA